MKLSEPEIRKELSLLNLIGEEHREMENAVRVLEFGKVVCGRGATRLRKKIALIMAKKGTAVFAPVHNPRSQKKYRADLDRAFEGMLRFDAKQRQSQVDAQESHHDGDKP